MHVGHSTSTPTSDTFCGSAHISRQSIVDMTTSSCQLVGSCSIVFHGHQMVQSCTSSSQWHCASFMSISSSQVPVESFDIG